MIGDIVDISEYIDLSFYNDVSYKYNSGIGVTSIGKWLGVSHILLGIMLYWILTQKNTVISLKTVKILSNLENESDEGRAIINEFESEIIRRFKEEEELTQDRAKTNPDN